MFQALKVSFLNTLQERKKKKKVSKGGKVLLCVLFFLGEGLVCI